MCLPIQLSLAVDIAHLLDCMYRLPSLDLPDLSYSSYHGDYCMLLPHIAINIYVYMFIYIFVYIFIYIYILSIYTNLCIDINKYIYV
jgi:hypothetical protein